MNSIWKFYPPLVFLLTLFCSSPLAAAEVAKSDLPRVRISPDGRGFRTEDGKPIIFWGVNYFRPGTGWAPQLWKQFDAEATRRDFARLKELGANCVRVFLTFGSFYEKPGQLSPEGLAKFDQLLALAAEAGLYVHPTGPDHWEGLPDWARSDRYAREEVLKGLEDFWRLFAARYRGRTTLMAYDLLNEPAIPWSTPALAAGWNQWVRDHYGQVEKAAKAWGTDPEQIQWEQLPVPKAEEWTPGKRLLDYQHYRESVADTWTRRQVQAIKSVDPQALVTVGLIQWSVPVLLPGLQHYSAFRPERQAPLLDFLEIHFYPLENGFYDYTRKEDEWRNLAYLESVVRAVARFGKPVILAEFGWYGGGQLTINDGKHPAASQEAQARWGRRVVETTAPWVAGWLNWGFYDHPESKDVTQLTGLLTVDGHLKAWGHTFQQLAASGAKGQGTSPSLAGSPPMEWDRYLTNRQSAADFRELYLNYFKSRLSEP